MATTLNEFERTKPRGFSPLPGGPRSQTSYSSSFAQFLKHSLGPLSPLSRVGWFSVIVILIGTVTLAFTYFALSRSDPFEISRANLLTFLVVDLAIALAIAPIIAWRLGRLLTSRRQSGAASKLHVRMVTLLSVMALVPTIAVASFSAVTFTTSLNSLLGGPVARAIQNSATMARFYVDEQTRVLGQDLVFMAMTSTIIHACLKRVRSGLNNSLRSKFARDAFRLLTL